MKYTLLILGYLFVALVALSSAMFMPNGMLRVFLVLSAVVTLIMGVYNLLSEKKWKEAMTEQMDRKIEAEECGDKTDYPDFSNMFQ